MSDLLILLSVGMMCIVLGYLIGYKKWTGLISGYNSMNDFEKAIFERDFDVDRFCKFIGNSTITIGLIIIFGGIAGYLGYESIGSVSTIATLIVVFNLTYVVVIRQNKRFRKIT